MNKKELITKISDLIEYGYYENDILNYILKDSLDIELDVTQLKLIIKSLMIENYLILHYRRMNDEIMTNELVNKFEIPNEVAFEVSTDFYSKKFNNLQSLIENSLMRHS